MKKNLLWMMAVILICGTSVLTSCSSNDDNPAQPELNVQQLVGKWLYVEADGEVVETEESSVMTFVLEGSTLKAFTSMSQKKYDLWACKQPTNVSVDGDKITLTMQVGGVTTVEEMTDITISGDDLRYTCKYTVMKNGEVVDALRPYQLHCVKVHDDYSQIIIGKWSGTITSDEPGFIPQPFCEEYRADGKNIAYNLIGGQWVQEESEYGEYFVDGNLMITRWKLSGRDEERQNCIIESYANGTLIIKEVVVRNGKLYTETSTLTKVEDEATPGALSGEFSVSASQKVHFSQGNLQYVGKWQFADHQWECFGSSQSDNHRDLFGWGTGAAPNKVSTDNNDYSTFVDWGTNAITNGGNKANVWRTLTKDEWVYLFYTRTHAATLFGLGSVNGVNGTILLPDDWTLPTGASFTASTTQGLADDGGHYYNQKSDNFSHNTYTTAQWAVMEANGAVFLPAAGSRNGTDVDYVGSRGGYRSATPDDTGNAYYLSFGSGLLYPQYKYDRYYGFSVRLVR